MNDNQLIQIFLPLINSGLVALGYYGVLVSQNYQPTMQGSSTGPVVYFFKVGNHRYGFLNRKDEWDPINNVMTHTESFFQESQFQVSALVTQDPTNVDTYTASDLCNAVAEIMQSDVVWEALQEQDVGIYRITDVRNPYFIDERDRYEAFPSFDFTLTYNNINITQSPIITPPIVSVLEGI